MNQFAIVSHDDFDGKAPVLLAEGAFGEQLVFHRTCSYAEVNQVVMDYINSDEYTSDVTLFITDLGLKDETMEALDAFVKKGYKVLLFDHHAQNEGLNRFEWANVIVEKEGVKTCGTSLFYEHLIEIGYLYPNAFLDSFVEIVRSYDTWDWAKNNDLLAKEFNRLFYLIGYNRMRDYFMKHFHGPTELAETPITEIPEEYVLSMDIDWEQIQEYIADAVKRVRFAKYIGYSIAVSFTEAHLPHVVEGVVDAFPELDFVCIINVAANKGSFRSRKNEVTVDWIAKEIGGGGHPYAAGFEPSDEMIATILTNLPNSKFL